MLEFLIWLEGSALGASLRSSGVWTYAFLNLGHIVGVSSLIGSVLILDLRLLGAWRRLRLGSVSTLTVPVAAGGFVIASISGFLMLSFNASEYYENPFLLVKFPAIALGLINVAVVSRLRPWRERAERELLSAERRQLAVAGGLSLVCWVTALAAGRMIGYY